MLNRKNQILLLLAAFVALASFGFLLNEAHGAGAGSITIPTTIPAGDYVPAPAQTLPVAVSPGPLVSSPKWLGLNLTGLVSTNRECPFIDWTKSSRRWGSFAKTYDQSAPLGTAGWPTTSAGTIWTGCTNVNGSYAISCPGEVKFTAFSASISNYVYDPVKNVSTATMIVNQPAGKVFDLALAIDSGGKPWTNLIIRAPFKATADGIFNQTWVDSLDPSLTVLRFMDWGDTNDSTIAHWSDRPQISDSQWSIKGVPLEICIALANDTNKDPWLNIPFLADDDYVRQFGRLVNAQLKPGLHCYVEYSNEIWNGIFDQYKQNVAATAAAVAAGDKTLADPSAPANVVYQQWRHVAERSSQIRTILDEVDPARSRFRVVLPIQVNGDLSMLPRMLDWTRSHAGDPSSIFYGVAGAPYFDAGSDPANPKAKLAARSDLTVDQLIAGFSANAPRAAASAGMIANAKAAHAAGLKFLLYECGEDDLQSNTSMDAKLAAQSDPRQSLIVSGFLHDCFASGADGGCWFSDAGQWQKFSCFDLRQHFADVSSPKYVGVISFSRGLAAANN